MGQSPTREQIKKEILNRYMNTYFNHALQLIIHYICTTTPDCQKYFPRDLERLKNMTDKQTDDLLQDLFFEDQDYPSYVHSKYINYCEQVRNLSNLQQEIVNYADPNLALCLEPLKLFIRNDSTVVLEYEDVKAPFESKLFNYLVSVMANSISSNLQKCTGLIISPLTITHDCIHANMLLIEIIPSKKQFNMYLYEPHGESKVSPLVYTHLDLLGEKIAELKFPGYTVFVDHGLCPIGIQKYAGDMLGFCLSFSYLVLCIALIIRRRMIYEYQMIQQYTKRKFKRSLSGEIEYWGDRKTPVFSLREWSDQIERKFHAEYSADKILILAIGLMNAVVTVGINKQLKPKVQDELL